MKAIYLTRESARSARATINAKAKAAGSNAMLKDAVKVTRGNVEVWTLPEALNHGKKLTLKKMK